jgi:hypothetical protein
MSYYIIYRDINPYVINHDIHTGPPYIACDHAYCRGVTPLRYIRDPHILPVTMPIAEGLPACDILYTGPPYIACDHA